MHHLVCDPHPLPPDATEDQKLAYRMAWRSASVAFSDVRDDLISDIGSEHHLWGELATLTGDASHIATADNNAKWLRLVQKSTGGVAFAAARLCIPFDSKALGRALVAHRKAKRAANTEPLPF